MHRNPKYFGPDPEVFRPERWETLKPGWEYLPFNGGPRICLGQQFALTEVGYTTVRICQEYSEIGPEPGHEHDPWVEKFSLTVCSKNGTKIVASI
jgi:cytochrome P450